MSTKDMNVALRLYLEANGLSQGLNRSGRDYSAFTGKAGRETARLSGLVAGVQRQVAALGLGVGALANQRLSANLDRDLTRIRQSAGATREQMHGLRAELFDMARATGQPMEGLQRGFSNLVASGMQWAQALATIKAINPASAVTGASEDVLSGGLTVAASTFKFDLAQPGMAAELLDKMTVAGRAGNAELEDLAAIFAAVGVNAKSANLEFDTTLGFVEALSKVQRNPERLATLADSTLRIFSNDNYKEAASRATGVPFYDAKNAARDPLAVLQDIAAKYQALQTDRARDQFVARGFGKTDLDTQRGIRTLLSGDTLQDWARISQEIRGASGTIARDQAEALDNAATQADRVKNSLREVGDNFARPINKALANVIDTAMAKKSEGGLGLSSTEVLGYGAGALIAGGLLGNVAASLPGKMMGGVGKLFGGALSTASGIAQGKALEQIAGVTPVFVTNWPVGGMGGGASAGGLIPPFGSGAGGPQWSVPGATGMKVAKFLGAFGVGAAAGGLIGRAVYNRFGDTEPFKNAADSFGRGIDKLLAALGSDDAERRLGYGRTEGASRMSGELKITLDQNGRLKLAGMESEGLDLRVFSGPLAINY